MSYKSQITLFLICFLFAVSANSAPMAFSVNSDSGNLANTDSLYTIDLTTGLDQRKGTLFNGIGTHVDTEGLAIAPDGTLWGVDDESLKLFRINTTSGSVSFTSEVNLVGIPAGGGNDFGMTFNCDGILYITSVVTNTLYRLNMNGTVEVVGALGNLGANISAIAAYDDPEKLYGLGNGQLQSGQTDSPNLYSIDTTTGVASLIGPLGAEAKEYNQGGLAFDAIGDLWAITDRRIINNAIENKPSQVLNIDPNSGVAMSISNSSEVGFESLAIAPPAACQVVNAVAPAQAIPVLSGVGRMLAIFVLLLSAMVILRKRST